MRLPQRIDEPRIVATRERIPTRNDDGDVNGWLLPIYNQLEKAVSEAQEPRQIYLTVAFPGEVKGPHLHLKRWGLFSCIRGNGRVITRTESGYQQFLTGERHGFAVVQVPAGVPCALQSRGDAESWFLNMPSPAWAPDDRDEHFVQFDDFDFAAWDDE